MDFSFARESPSCVKTKSFSGSAVPPSRILEKQNHQLANAKIQKNLTHLSRVLLFKDSRRSIRRHDPFALPGDSGSLIVSEDANSAIGLLFALNNKGEYGIFVLIEDLLRPLRFAWGKLSDWI